MNYARIIGEKSVKFDFLSVYRPAVTLPSRRHSTVPPSFSATPPRGRPWLRHATAALGYAVQLPLHPQERSRARDCCAVGADVPSDRAGQRSQGGNREDPGIQGDGAVLRQRRDRGTLSSTGYSGNSTSPFIPDSELTMT